MKLKKERTSLMKKLVFNICKIFISSGIIPLWFIKLFHDVGHFQSQNNINEIVRIDFYYSMIDNIKSLDLSFLIYISFALIAISIVTAALSIKCRDNKKISFISNISFVLTLTSFLVFLLLASTVSRGY